MKSEIHQVCQKSLLHNPKFASSLNKNIMKSLTFIALLSINTICYSQVSGNINYRTINDFSQNAVVVSPPRDGEIYINVKGMANVKADQFVAIFSVTQTGKTQTEANQIIDERISESLKQIKLQKNVEIFTDMISFVPVYDYETVRKLFSKRTYNEIPKGFEIKKNIHIKFSNAQQLDGFIKNLAENEIYDLVRVDYYSTKLDDIKKEVSAKAKTMLAEKVKSYETIAAQTFINEDKTFSDGFITKLPVEMYKSYEAYNSSSLDLVRSSNINQVSKNSTIYYQPIFDKDFDFVLNPVVLEPVIQIMYEVKMKIKKVQTNKKEYLIMNSNGDLKSFNIPK